MDRPLGAADTARYSDAASYLCRNAADLRAELGDDHWDSLIRAFLAATPRTGAWRDAIQASHDAALAVGIPGGLGLGVTMSRGFPDGPPPRSAGWACPGRCCSLVILREEAGGALVPGTPACSLSGQPMRFVE